MSTVKRAISRLGLIWKRPRYDLALWRQAKGGSKGPQRPIPDRPHDARRGDHHRDAPLYFAYGWPGEQVRVPISGNRAKRILHGVINIKT